MARTLDVYLHRDLVGSLFVCDALEPSNSATSRRNCRVDAPSTQHCLPEKDRHSQIGLASRYRLLPKAVDRRAGHRHGGSGGVDDDQGGATFEVRIRLRPCCGGPTGRCMRPSLGAQP
jgi:hypothetical protein